jgi:hypothetical protein
VCVGVRVVSSLPLFGLAYVFWVMSEEVRMLECEIEGCGAQFGGVVGEEDF